MRTKWIFAAMAAVSVLGVAQEKPATGPSANAAAPHKPHAVLLVGLAPMKANTAGTLSVTGDGLNFETAQQKSTNVKATDIDNLTTGEESKQVGGVPLTLAKMGIPFGGGRAVSLVSHKKFDTLTVEFHDANGAQHGAVFNLPRGSAAELKKQLVALGAHAKEPPTAPAASAQGEKK